MDEKVILSKNAKKLKWTIFKDISVVDTIILLFSFVLGGMWFAFNISLKIQITFATLFWFTGLLNLIEINVDKFWVIIALLITFLFSYKKQQKTKGKTTSFKNNKFILTKNATTFSAWKITFKISDTNNKNLFEKDLNTLADFIKLVGEDHIIKFYKTNGNINLQNQAKNTSLLKKNCKEKAILDSISVEEQMLEAYTQQSDLKYPTLYLFILFGSTNKANIEKDYQFLNLQILKHFHALQVDPTIFNNIETNFFANKDIKFNATHLLEMNSTNKFKLLSVEKFPINPIYGWMAKLLSITNEALITIKPILKIQAQKYLDNTILKVQNIDTQISKETQRQSNTDYYDGIQEMIKQINEDDDVLKEMNVILKCDTSTNDKQLKINQEIKLLESTMNFKINKLVYRQQKALESFAIENEDKLMTRFGIPLTSKQIANGYMLTASSLEDENGQLIALTINQELPIVFDLFKKDIKRKNSNAIILGTSGSGKSVLLKKLIKLQAMHKTKIFLIDIEKEYQNLTSNLGGNYISFGKKDSLINPLQIFNTDDENGFDSQLIFLQTLFKILFDTNDYFTNELVNICQNTYKKFKITKKTDWSKVANTQWPIFSDVFKVGKTSLSKDKKMPEQDKRTLLSYLKTLHEGQYNTLLNNYTNIQIKNTFITFGLNHLADMNSQSINNIVMYLILRLIESEILKNRQRLHNIMLVVDEAWKLVDQNNPIALEFLFSQAKRIRKYNGSLILATQNIKDLSGTHEIAKYTEGIINNCQYHFYGNLKLDDLKTFIEISNAVDSGLNESTIDFIKNAERGKFFFQVSPEETYEIQVIYEDYEVKLFESRII